MEKQRTRDEISNEYKWDLTTIFKTDDEFYDLLGSVKEDLSSFRDFKGKLVLSASDLYKFLTFSDDFERKMYRLYY